MSMTADEVLARVAELPREDWIRIQAGIAEMVAAGFTTEENTEIRNALAEAEAEFTRGEGMSGGDLRRRLGLP